MSRVYVDNPASVPPRFEPQRGAGGGWYYETESQDDDIPQELIRLITDQILPGMDEESVTQDSIVDEVEQELAERAEQYKGVIQKTVQLVMTEQITKLRMDRVYVNNENEIPEGCEALTDDNGDLYYDMRDAHYINSDRSSKSRVYVGDESEVPSDFTAQYGRHGGVYYETDEHHEPSMGERAQASVADVFGGVNMDGMEEMAEDIVDALMEFVPVERDRADHMTDEQRERIQEVADQAAQRQFDLLENSVTGAILTELTKRELSEDDFMGAIMELSKALIGFSGGIEKSRTYVSSPEEVPEGYEVEEGGRGGYYYETGDSSGMSAEGLDEMDEDELEDFRDYLMDQHEAAHDAREARGGRGTDTPEDELMRDIMDVVMDVDSELMDRDGI